MPLAACSVFLFSTYLSCFWRLLSNACHPSYSRSYPRRRGKAIGEWASVAANNELHGLDGLDGLEGIPDTQQTQQKNAAANNCRDNQYILMAKTLRHVPYLLGYVRLDILPYPNTIGPKTKKSGGPRYLVEILCLT